MAPKSNRQKSKSTINGPAEFQVALDELAIDTLQLEELGNALETELAAVREKHSQAIADLSGKMDAALRDLEKFATVNRATLFPSEAKTAQSPLTEFGFRTSPAALALLARWDWSSVIAQIKQRQSRALAVIQTTTDPEEITRENRWLELIATEEAPVKDRIKSLLSEDELAEIGCRLRINESFWVEPKRDAIAERRLSTQTTEVPA